MANLNKAEIEGRVGRLDFRYSKNGNAMLSMSIATSYKQKEEWKTDWHLIKFYGDHASDINSQVDKGDVVYVTGAIKSEEYQSKNGQTVKALFILGFDWELKDKNKKNNIHKNTETNGYSPSDMDEVPF